MSAPKARKRGFTTRVAPRDAYTKGKTFINPASDKQDRSSVEGERTSNQFDDLDTEFLKRFESGSNIYRQGILLAILKACDPYDMRFLNFSIPRYHRNFLSKLDKNIVYRVLQYLHPKHCVTVAGVCKDWYKLMRAQETWFALYKSIGLESLASVFYIQNGTALQNSKRFYSYGNWAHGIFSTRQFQAHSLGILCMAYDGKLIATGSTDRSCKLFNMNGQCLKTFSGHDDAVTAIQFDDEKVVSGSADWTIKVWSMKEGAKLWATFRNCTGPITCLDLDKDLLISGSEDKIVRIWDLSELTAKPIENTGVINLERRRAKVAIKSTIGACKRSLYGHQSAVKCLAHYNDIIFSGDVRGNVRIWHLTTGNCLNVIGIHSSSDNVIHLGLDDRDPDNRKPKLNLENTISSIQLNEKRLLIATLSGDAFLFDLLPQPSISNSGAEAYDASLEWATRPETFIPNSKFTLLEKRQSHGANWCLCAKADEWRLMCGGSLGYISVWNHRIQKYLYKLKTGDEEDESGGGLENRVGSLMSFGKKDKDGSEVRALTGLAFNDLNIVAASMNGTIHIWEPNV